MTSTKVLYVGGYSRSGSTLFDCMLGQLPGFFSTGELAYIWTHGLQENRLCGCGSRFLECRFWAQVGERAFGGWTNVAADEMLALERRVNRHRLVPLLIEPRLSETFALHLRRYAAVLSAIYGAIREVSGARVIVDSTIDPAYGFLLRHVPGVDLHLVHMVRDSRATAFSWTRRQLRTDRPDTTVYQRRFRPSMTAVRWDAYHGLVHLLSALGPRALLVRYEDVVRQPELEIHRVAAHVGEPVSQEGLEFIRPGAVELGVNHTFAGSLMRLRQGTLPVRLDDEWRASLRPRDRRLVTVLSAPLLATYRYLGNGGPPAPPAQRLPGAAA